MPVTLSLGDSKPAPFQRDSGNSKVEDLFVSTRLTDFRQKAESEEASKKYSETLIQSELSPSSPSSPKEKIYARQNGLVHALEAAYSNHHHLVLRPDDVWICLLTQFSIYVNKNAEKLRHLFVSHEGQKKLVVTGNGTLFSADYAAFARQMTDKLAENIKDPAVRDWLLPSFSTTTTLDTSVSAVIMMATLKKYFSYEFSLLCGIPKVTLQGEKRDWEMLREKIDAFDQYGDEPKQWTALLRPILDSFTSAFDVTADSTGAELKQQQEFWSRVCHYTGGGSGPTYLCGWATVFTIWDEDGKFRTKTPQQPGEVFILDEGGEPKELDSWPKIDTDKITKGVAEVPVVVDDNGTTHDTVLLAGSPGFKLSKSQEIADGDQEVLSPIIGWAMYKVPASQESQA